MLAERFESALWQTSSLLLARDGEAVLVDPCISREEVARIAARAAGLGLRVAAVLATHADWDHVCGIAAFPAAEAAMGEATATRVESGRPDERIAEQAAAYGIAVSGPARVDRRLGVGRAHRVGPFTVETLALPGHTPERHGVPRPRARPARRRRPSLDGRVPVRLRHGRLPRHARGARRRGAAAAAGASPGRP